MKYDCIIIGAGVIGATLARNLAKYDLNVLVLEKNSDVGEETSAANSAIVHSGYDPHPGTLKALLNKRGNELMEQECKELDVEFKRIGSLTLACNDEEVETLNTLAEYAKENGVETKILSASELFELEPYATKQAIKALWAPTAGIINPFELVVALMENAMDNGVKLNLNEEVTGITKLNDSYKVDTNVSSYEAKVVFNCAGLNSDVINNFVNTKIEKVTPRKGEYYVLDHNPLPYVTHTLFSVPSSKGKGVLVSPTTHGNYLIGPSSEFVDLKDDKAIDGLTLKEVINQAKRLVDNIPMQYVIREFSGLRAYHESNDFVINSPVEGFINLLGIQSPGLASSPAIAEYVMDNYVSKILELKEKPSYNPIRRPLYRVNTLSVEDRQALIKQNPDFGKMVCRCEQVTLGEVKDCINRNCGAITVKGVKRRVRPGFGKCQGGFCEPLIMKILSSELGVKMEDLRYCSKDSYILQNKTKGEE